MIQSLWYVVAWICLISVCSAQQYYDPNNCTSSETVRGSRYTCNSTQGDSSSCKAYLVYRANERFRTISQVSKLFNMNSDDVLKVNNFTAGSSSQVLKLGKEVLLPVNCTCSGQFYEASLSYKVPQESTTFSQIACGVFEGLLEHLTLVEENLNLPQGPSDNEHGEYNPEAGSVLQVPLRCACPNNNVTSTNMGVKYLVTYPLIPGDDSDKLSYRFGISPEDFFEVNNLLPLSTLYPETVVLIPIKDVPIRIYDYPDPPSPPPGFLPTQPVILDTPEESTEPSNLYIAGPVLGFLLFITLLASGGLYMKKRLMKSDSAVHSFNQRNFPILWSPTRISTTTTTCLSPDLLVGIKYCLINYHIEEIQKATKNFSEENKIGDLVYKGSINYSNMEVMIKKMIRVEDTRRVIDLHSKINHINIVNLLGVCYGDENNNENVSSSWSYLVFELPKNGSLRDCISDPSNPLNWYRRTQIAFDIATCLYYLHCCSFPSYAHMNVSSRNIFITANWRGKLADFGRFRNEYGQNTEISKKVDIFAFGVVLLELISGRDNFVDGKTNKDWLGFLFGEEASDCFEGLRGFMDPNLKDYSLPEALCLSILAKDCVADDPFLRPSMDDIMKVLAKMV